MTIQNRKKLAVAYLIIGAVIAVVAATTHMEDSFHSGILTGFSSSLIAIGALQLLKLHRLTRDPEKAAEYEVSQKDERLLYIAGKARSMTFAVNLYAELAAGLIAMFVFDQRLLGTALCYLVCFQALLFVGLYYYYNRKY